MYKGIILDIKKDYVITLREGGGFEKIKKKEGTNVGDAIFFLEEDIYEKKNRNKFNKNSWGLIIIAATIMILTMIPMIKKSMIENKVYAVISIDINPSIEIDINNNKKIINITSVNEDAKNINLSSLKGLELEKGIQELKTILNKMNYDTNSMPILIGFSFVDEIVDNDFETSVKNAIFNTIDGENMNFIKGTNKDLENSRKKGISIGRYEVGKNIDDDLYEDEIEKMSVNEILTILKENKNINIEVKKELEEELQDKIEKEQEKKEEEKEEIEKAQDAIKKEEENKKEEAEKLKDLEEKKREEEEKIKDLEEKEKEEEENKKLNEENNNETNEEIHSLEDDN